MQVAQRLVRFARKTPRQQLQIARAKFRYRLVARVGKVPHVGKDRTAYIIGLFGTGRSYVNELLVHNIGERARYFRDNICFHPCATSMVYSGHATIKYVSRAQELPTQMKHILQAVTLGFADSIFVYRHPLDSLLTNWVWWRTYIRDRTMIKGISQVYKRTEDLCADLDQNFPEFQAFAEGDPNFYAVLPGPRFLSFSEFVEETDLHMQSATLAVRLEDFMIDPLKEFSKIVQLMSLDLELSHLQLAPPNSQPFGYLAVKKILPRFRDFIHALDGETKGRIGKIGYKLDDLS